MQNAIKKVGIFALFIAAIGSTPYAHAENRDVEATMQTLGDVSMFDQGLTNSGVAHDMHDNQHYTIFAPVNAAFVDVPQAAYPCFYASPCRPQIAALLRDHIVPGRHDLKELSEFSDKVDTLGARPVHVEEKFVGDYTVNGKRILSKAESNGNIIYRIDGLLADREDMEYFRTARQSNQLPEGAIVQDSVTTVTTPLMPDAVAPIPSSSATDTAMQTTTVVRHTVVQP